MCGLAGIIHLDGRPLDAGYDKQALIGMGDAMAHRGPDGTSLLQWENTGFMFKRLAIMDLAGGEQPFHAADGLISAMTNGEIYNHREIRASLLAATRFRSASDCEVIPHLYQARGLDMFGPVNGMFATALLDRRHRRVLLARDRLGVKPLFYTLVNGDRTLVFASEVKALFAHPDVPRQFDWGAALTRKYQGDTDAGELSSGFVGIERVPAGHMLDISLEHGSRTLHCYWRMPARTERPEERAEGYYIEGYRQLLEDSVLLRLKADVDYGLFLSGGIDSAAIAALAARHGELPTFSVLSKATLRDARAARKVAEAFGLPNHQVLFDSERLALDPEDWRRILWCCEIGEITAEQLFKYHLHAYARKRYPGIKVILLGQGSDEFNGGYTGTLLDRHEGFVAADWARVGSVCRKRDAIQQACLRGVAYMDMVAEGVIRPDFIDRLAGRYGGRNTWELYTGLFRSNLDYHLWHEDRTASAHSMENRLPYLDYRLVEFIAGIPESHHAALFTDKRILRRAMADLLPAEIVNRPKGPFFYGEGEHHVANMMHALLMRNDAELIQQALAGSERTDGPLDGRIMDLARDLGAGPSARTLTPLLWLVNMGVLADMASHGRAGTAGKGALSIGEIVPEEWPPWWQAAGTPRVRQLEDGQIPVLAQGITLVETSEGMGSTTVTRCCLSFGDRLEEIKSPSWAAFLKRVDGHRTYAEILEGQSINRTRMARQVESALARGILEIRHAPPEQGQPGASVRI